MTSEDECGANEFADMVERAAAKYRAGRKSFPSRPLREQHVMFERELRTEIQKRAAARTEGAAARSENR